MNFDSVSIIYNPNSTGNAPENAKKLKSELTSLFPGLKIELHKTKYAGHAQEIAFKLSQDSKKPLIISSSGDGGYNEVINGAMQAQLEGAKPICAVMPSGNANDHSRTLQNYSLSKSIKTEKISSIDLLKIKVSNGSKKYERYAHSYIGFGLTPAVAEELNKKDLNKLNELWIAARTLYKLKPFKISHKNKILTLDSIIFTNISEMAKVLTISKDSQPDDGLFEIVSFHHDRKTKLLNKLANATLNGLDTTSQAKSYEFTALKSMPVQLDGEVIKIEKDSLIKITSEHKVLTTIL